MKIIFFANTDWYLFNFRLPLAHWLRARGHEILFLSPPGDYCERLRAAGFRWEPLPMDRRSLNPWREWRLLNHIRRLYARERPDLVHHFTIKSVVYGSLAARTLGIRRRVNAVTGQGHVFTDSGLKARALRPLVRALLRLALGGAGSRLILQNPDDERAFRTAGLIDPERIRLIRGSGVDTTRFGEYVAAARVLRASGMAIECLLAGEPDPGNPAAIPEDQLERWRAEGNVVLLGHVDDMPALLERVDIAVLPTSYGEGVPRSLLEAAACGLPLIATDVPGCREIVRDDENGLLIPARDSAALTAAIRRLSQDAALRARFGAASRARVLDDFDQTLVFERTLEVYRELEAMDRHR
jgi:glycosyltransferase involved in cell wall biosynthesis